MTRLAVRLLTVPAVLAVAVAVATLNPASLAGAEDTSGDIFATAHDPELAALDRALDAKLEQVTERTAMKEDLADRLIAGQLHLGAAADGFLRLNETDPECVALMRINFRASSDRESAARNILEYVRQRATAAAWPKLSARLIGEYAAAFGHTPRI